jgi:hypothetical protein
MEEMKVKMIKEGVLEVDFPAKMNIYRKRTNHRRKDSCLDLRVKAAWRVGE